MTRRCSTSSRCSSRARLPPAFPPGCRGPAGHDAGDLSSVTRSRSRLSSFLAWQRSFLLPPAVSAAGAACRISCSAALFRSYSRWAFNIRRWSARSAPGRIAPADGVFLVFPLCLHAAELVLQLGQLEVLQAALAQASVSFSGSPADLQLGDAVGQIVHLVGAYCPSRF